MRVALTINSLLTVFAALLLWSHYAMGATILANVDRPWQCVEQFVGHGIELHVAGQHLMGAAILANVIVLMLSGFLCVSNSALSVVLTAKAQKKWLPLGNMVLAVAIFAWIVHLFSTNSVPAGYGP